MRGLMSWFLQVAYDWILLPLTQILTPLVFQLRPNGKVALTLRGQKLALEDLRQQLKSFGPRPKKVWFHVASAGEFLQAKPVIELLKIRNPEVLIVVSYVSPSAVRWVKTFAGADIKVFAPLDTLHNMSQFVELVQPAALVLVKFDIWPNMIRATHAKQVPILLLSATLSANSGRYRNPITKTFFRDLYAQIKWIACVGADDAKRFRETNPNHSGVHVVGDTRVDSVLTRQSENAKKELQPQLQTLRRDHEFILIVGSAWGADEDLVFPAWDRFRAQNTPVRALLIVVPHEPDETHLLASEKHLERLNLIHVRWSQLAEVRFDQAPSVLLVDRIGMLADLYRIGDAAFVGAGDGGVHNTMEPAAWRLPVVFRPVFHNAPEAISLVEQKVFQALASSDQLVAQLENWLKNLQAARALGQKGRDFLEKSQGATYTCYEYLQKEL